MYFTDIERAYSIEFQFLSVDPQSELGAVLGGVWELQAPGGMPPQCYAPDGCAELVVHMSGSVERHLKGKPLEGSDYSLAHPISGGVVVAQMGCVHIRALRFRPGGLFAVGAKPEAVRDCVVEPESCFGDLAKSLGAILRGASDLQDVLACIAPLLVTTARRIKAEPLFTPRVLRQLAFDPSEHALERLTGWSARHTRRLMLRETGYTPSEFQRVAQFHRARHLIETSSLSLADIASRAGYVDQAHMSRRVKDFSGSPPAKLRRSSLSLARIYRPDA